jgi:glycosyltransferase involved in cell wall biosynthesis
MSADFSTKKKSRLKILMLCKRHYTNRDLITHRFGRLFHLPFQLAQKGVNFVVVTADYKNKKPEKKDISGIGFCSFPFRVSSLIMFFYKYIKIIRFMKPDIIIASSDSHFGLIGLITAKICKIPFVFDIYDDYRVFGTNKLPFMKTFFELSVKKADLVICSSNPLYKQLSKKNRSCIVVENGVDTERFCPRSIADARQKAGISSDKTVIGYFGSISGNRGVETLIRAVKILKKDLPQISLLIAGKNDLGISFDKSYIDYRGEVEQEKIPLFINASDVVVIPYHPDPQVNMSNPCKLTEYLSCETPIVATKVSDLENLLGTLTEALCLPSNTEDMVRAIKWQLENRKTISLPNNLTWEALGTKLKNELERLL